jgi:heterodisulfide reductase subunit C
MEPIIPNDAQRQIIEQNAMAGSCLCWTCGTCDSECPIYLSTGRLRPQVIVRMANLGMLDEMLALPQIWYCLGCRRCGSGCPNQVKPFEVMRYLRDVMIHSGRIGAPMAAAYRKLMGQFQRVRYRAILRAMHGEFTAISTREWYQWFEKPIRNPLYKEIEFAAGAHANKPFTVAAGHNPSACLSCSECSSCCPIFYERTTFDPQSIIRMANLGLTDELIKSPSIWMCLGCRRCSQTCSQLVSGYDVISRLRLLAIERGHVDPCFPSRLVQLDRLIYPRLLEEIDHQTGMFGTRQGKSPDPNSGMTH